MRLFKVLFGQNLLFYDLLIIVQKMVKEARRAHVTCSVRAAVQRFSLCLLNTREKQKILNLRLNYQNSC